MTRRMKDSGVEWIGEIPEDWEVVKNKYLFKNKKKIVGDQFELYDLLSLTKNRGIIYRDINAKEGKLPESFSTYQSVKKDDLVLCLFDLDISAVFSDVSRLKGMISSAYNIFEIDNNYPRFYKYWFDMINDGRKYKIYSKSLRSTIDIENFNNLSTIRPPQYQQKSIANFLDKKTLEIDNIISKTKEVIKEYKKYKQSLITEVVTGGLNKDVAMKDSGIEWIGKMPEHWDMIKLKYLVACNKNTLSSSIKDDYEFRYVDIGSVDFHKGITEYENMKYKDSPSRARRVVKKGDLIVSTVRTYLRSIATIIDDKDVIVSTGFAVLTPININEKYLEYITKTEFFISEVISESVGVSYPAINAKDLLEIKISFPSLNEQKQIANYLDKKCTQIDNIIQTKEKLLVEMESYKKSLIYETVTGKREVN